MSSTGDKIKFVSYAKELLSARVTNIISDQVVLKDNPKNPANPFRNREIMANVITLLPSGQLVPQIKNLVFTQPRWSEIEGLDVADGSPIHPEALTTMALMDQAERTGGASQSAAATVEV